MEDPVPSCHGACLEGGLEENLEEEDLEAVFLHRDTKIHQVAFVCRECVSTILSINKPQSAKHSQGRGVPGLTGGGPGGGMPVGGLC